MPMDFDLYSRAAFEAIASDPEALRLLVDRLQEDVLLELHRVVAERFAAIVRRAFSELAGGFA